MVSDDLPEPTIPLRNMGEILDKEIPIRVKIEMDKVRTIEFEKRKERGIRIFKIFGQLIPVTISAIIVLYR